MPNHRSKFSNNAGFGSFAVHIQAADINGNVGEGSVEFSSLLKLIL